MDRIYEVLQEVFRDVFNDDTLVPVPAMTADDVDGWDSFRHIRLVLAVEQRVGVKFTAAEIGSFRCVGDMVATIATKVPRAG